jgi:hypothetical protein
LQVDVTSKTEGTVKAAFADGQGLPLLVKYDARIKQDAEQPVKEIFDGVADAEGASTNYPANLKYETGNTSMARCVSTATFFSFCFGISPTPKHVRRGIPKSVRSRHR